MMPFQNGILTGLDRLKQGLRNRCDWRFHRPCFSLLHNMLHIDALDLAEVVEDQVQKELGVVGQIAVLQADQGQPLGERLVLVPEGEDVDVRRDAFRKPLFVQFSVRPDSCAQGAGARCV